MDHLAVFALFAAALLYALIGLTVFMAVFLFLTLFYDSGFFKKFFLSVIISFFWPIGAPLFMFYLRRRLRREFGI